MINACSLYENSTRYLGDKSGENLARADERFFMSFHKKPQGVLIKNSRSSHKKTHAGLIKKPTKKTHGGLKEVSRGGHESRSSTTTSREREEREHVSGAHIG